VQVASPATISRVQIELLICVSFRIGSYARSSPRRVAWLTGTSPARARRPLALPTLFSLPVTWSMGEASPRALKSR
jgi:hypothetical protein